MNDCQILTKVVRKQFIKSDLKYQMWWMTPSMTHCVIDADICRTLYTRLEQYDNDNISNDYQSQLISSYEGDITHTDENNILNATCDMQYV